MYAPIDDTNSNRRTPRDNPDIAAASRPTPEFRVLPARHLADPEVKSGENPAYRTERQHKMEVRNHVVGIVQDLDDARICQYHSSHTANGECEDEADRPQHRRSIGMPALR